MVLLSQGKHRLLGEDGDAPLPLQAVGIQKGVPVVYPAQFFDCAPSIEQCLREGGLPRVHMGQQTHDQIIHDDSPADVGFSRFFL